MEKVNGGNAIETLGKVIKTLKTVADVVKGSGKDSNSAASSAPTTNQNVSGNETKGKQNINTGKFIDNDNSTFGGY